MQNKKMVKIVVGAMVLIMVVSSLASFIYALAR